MPDLAAQDPDLVAENRDLDVLRCVAGPVREPEEAAQHQVQDRQNHEAAILQMVC
jgi:hypothetical protein